MPDIGDPGYWLPRVVSEGPMNELRNIAGERPFANSKMITVNLFTGEVQWLQARARTSKAPARRRRK